MSDRPEVVINREVVYRVAEHETLLAFNSDLDNEVFQLWWTRTGEDLFAKFRGAYVKRHYA